MKTFDCTALCQEILNKVIENKIFECPKCEWVGESESAKCRFCGAILREMKRFDFNPLMVVRPDSLKEIRPFWQCQHCGRLSPVMPGNYDLEIPFMGIPCTHCWQIADFQPDYFFSSKCYVFQYVVNIARKNK